MIKIGDQLLELKTGWRRYNDNNKNISYIGDNWSVYNNNNYYIGNSRHQCSNNTIKPKIKFNFIGSKFILLGTFYNSYSNKIEVKIDNKIIEYYNLSKHQKEGVQYIKENLNFCEHCIEIIKINKGLWSVDFVLSAIDIDENGKLKPYNSDLYYYLIQQNNNLYSIKSDYFKNLKQQTLSKELLKKYGTLNINDLCVLRNTNYIEQNKSSTIGNGKMFEIPLSDDIISVDNIDIE